MIGTSRLGYALAADGLFPRVFARIHPKFKTPYLAIIIQAVSALVAAAIGQLDTLIATSVFFMAIAYAATGASVFFLRRKGAKTQFNVRGGLLIPILGVAFSIYLIMQCTLWQIVLGVVLLLAGVPIYVKYSPKRELTELKEAFLSREAVVQRLYGQEERFLAHALRHVKRVYRRLTGKGEKWDVSD
jgi:amino acid transporter